MDKAIKRAAEKISTANAMFITAGAGMGVDSGLPDFRGSEGFWRAYPPIKKRGLTLPEMSTPHWFVTDPKFAWGFFGHRLKLYRNGTPHQGFELLQKWCKWMKNGHFVYTTNVDGHFQKAGFTKNTVFECHGSINYLQSISGVEGVWSVPEDMDIVIDDETLSAQLPLPKGPPGISVEEQTLARPNILMFNDLFWNSDLANEQEKHFQNWFRKIRTNPISCNLVVVEIGAGLVVPTIRHISESIARSTKGCLIRINPNEAEVPVTDHVSLRMRGLDALRQIDEVLTFEQ